MKKYFSIVMLASVLFGFTACESDDTEGLTRITYYPTLTVVGGDVIVPVGGTYTEQGCTAILNGTDITDQVEISSDVNTDEMGIYTVSYSAVNSDGFTASASRTVYVTNPGHVNTLYFGSTKYGSRSYSGAPVKIEDNGDGTYSIDDVLAGFYWNGRYPGYEPTYDFHAEADIKIDDSGVSVISVGSWYFGAYAITIASSSYDAATGVISYSLDGDFSGFTATLTPIE